MLSLIILFFVLALIAVRRVGPLRFEIWQIMLLGALAAVLSGDISPNDAVAAINLDVLFFLFGVFVIGRALEESGYLEHLSYKLFRRAGSVDALVLFLLFGVGLASALLMNDTLAIIGTPVVLMLGTKHHIPAKPLLIALAFAVTIGSVPSSIGNPQNLLVALGGNMADPFIPFIQYLFVPTIINLFIAYAALKIFYPKAFHDKHIEHADESVRDARLASLSRISLILMALLIAAKIIIVLLVPSFEFRLTYIALASALPVIIFSNRRMEIIKKIDWRTLVFFAAMFVLMQSVWNAGVFQKMITDSGANIKSVPSILLISVVLSQFVSNVPLVALYLPVLMQAGAGTKELVALAAGSTIAGNLFILGAASNVIIIQNAEKRGGETLTFWEFARIGIPLTAINVAVYWLFLSFT